MPEVEAILSLMPSPSSSQEGVFSKYCEKERQCVSEREIERLGKTERERERESENKF